MESSHYGSDYYSNVYRGFDDEHFAKRWALGCAIIGGYADKSFSSVLEFGCGLGQNLNVIAAAEKWGVDINDASRHSCARLGFQWRSTLDDVPDGKFDFILARHSLEHVLDPADVLRTLLKKLAPGGSAYIVVPLEEVETGFDHDHFDEHRHLFSWTPLTLKNVLLATGWSVKRIDVTNGSMMPRSVALLPNKKSAFKAVRKFLNHPWIPRRSAETGILAVPSPKPIL